MQNRLTAVAILSASMAFIAFGCASHDDVRVQLQERLDAATSIQSAPQRDWALSNIATDAAHTGNVAVSESAVSQISAGPARDTAALDAARVFESHRDRSDAMVMAKMIDNAVFRDGLMAEFAADAPLPPAQPPATQPTTMP